MVLVVAGANLDHGLGQHVVALVVAAAVAVAFDDDEVLDLEGADVAGKLAADEKLEAGFGALVLEALALLLLDGLEEVADLVLGEGVVDAELVDLDEQVALAGELADEDAAAVADETGVDVLVGALVLHDAGDVVAGLVGEGALADEGGLGVRHEVGELVDVVGDLGEARELVVLDDVDAHLELEVGGDGEEVGVAAALAVAVYATLHLPDARLDGGEAVGDGEADVVVAVDAETRIGDAVLDGLDSAEEVGGGHATVGVTEDEGLGAGAGGGGEALEGVVGVAGEAVEEVLGIEEDGLAEVAEVTDGVGDHGEVFLVAGLEDALDLVLAGLADEGHAGGLGGDHALDVGVGFAGEPGAAGAAESAHPGLRELDLLEPLEVGGVAGVGAGEAALDPLDAELVELLGDAHLIGDREGDALHLGAVAEGGVVELDSVGRHGEKSAALRCAARG